MKLRHVSLMNMSTKMSGIYEDAIVKLNGLQSNAATLEKIKTAKQARDIAVLFEMKDFWRRMGYTDTDLSRLRVIHIAGTKGKGSTSAFCESILRNQGKKTGLFTSPHLLEVRERIRINGVPLGKHSFGSYFFECWKRLKSSEDENSRMPGYFQFLSLMGFHVFLEEKVDVAIMEVGIGGHNDPTNIIGEPYVCGIASLGYDHLNVLGNTLAEIAWHKAGIFKPNVVALTTNQPEEAMNVLQKRAYEIKAPLFVTSPLENYEEVLGKSIELGLKGDHQRINAALAVGLCQVWQRKYQGDPHFLDFHSVNENLKLTQFPMLHLDKAIERGLKECRWPGRAQIIEKGHICYFIDGAHTSESIKVCREWFKASQRSTSSMKILLFNCTPDRHMETLLKPLTPLGDDSGLSMKFDQIIFCPSLASLAYGGHYPEDIKYSNMHNQLELSHQHSLKKQWSQLVPEFPLNDIHVLSSLEEAIHHLHDLNEKIDVLVTGSLHFVGAFFRSLGLSIEEISETVSNICSR